MTRILIVEDEHAVAEVIEEFLDGLGFQTETVPDGQQAVDRAQQEPPDLIIMDLMMPRLTGGEAARLLKQDPSTAEIPILAISSVDDVHEFADVLAVDAVLSKPFDLADLESRVTGLLPDETPPAASV